MNLRSKDVQPSESMPLGLMLAIVGGFLDAYTFSTRGGVFSNAITGNIVLLGLNLANLDFFHAFRYFLSLFAFASGVLIISLIQKRIKYITLIHWREIVLATEIVLIFVVGLIPNQYDTIANIIVPFTCAIQISTFRKVKGYACATTMCTGNLRVATESLFGFITSKDKNQLKKSLTYYVVITFFLIGAIIGLVACKFWAIHAVWLCCIMLLLFLLCTTDKNMEY
ncbi:MAG: YoaK family protein [Muribaculaceae bacterium]